MGTSWVRETAVSILTDIVSNLRIAGLCCSRLGGRSKDNGGVCLFLRLPRLRLVVPYYPLPLSGVAALQHLPSTSRALVGRLHQSVWLLDVRPLSNAQCDEEHQHAFIWTATSTRHNSSVFAQEDQEAAGTTAVVLCADIEPFLLAMRA